MAVRGIVGMFVILNQSNLFWDEYSGDLEQQGVR